MNVAACLTEVEALIQATTERAIRFDIQANSDLPFVTCDPLALQNAVLNLVFNARDAMPDGGSILLRAAAISLESGPGIELRIADSGVGMKPDTIVRAFDTFFTTKCDGLGGIGLPMVARFAQEIGGRVLIESEYGVGTTVRVQLPVSPQGGHADGPIPIPGMRESSFKPLDVLGDQSKSVEVHAGNEFESEPQIGGP